MTNQRPRILLAGFVIKSSSRLRNKKGMATNPGAMCENDGTRVVNACVGESVRTTDDIAKLSNRPIDNINQLDTRR
jgi:hypothetical protein